MSLVEYLADHLLVAPAYVDTLCRTSSFCYKEYLVPKRTGGTRTIEHPSRPLKAVQRLLLRDFVSKFEVHPASSAYGPGCSVGRHARKHLGAAFVLRMDFADFFPSIRTRDVERVLASAESLGVLPISMTPTDVRNFCALVCRNGRLVIGAPTSPQLSNAIMRDLDHAIAMLSSQHGLRYSRYADDLFFSSLSPNVLPHVEGALHTLVQGWTAGPQLAFNPSKTRRLSRKRAMRVTGVVLTPDAHVSVGRERKRMIRTMLFRFASLSEEERRTLAGHLGFAIDVEPELANRLARKYGATTVRRAMRPPRS